MGGGGWAKDFVWLLTLISAFCSNIYFFRAWRIQVINLGHEMFTVHFVIFTSNIQLSSCPIFCYPSIKYAPVFYPIFRRLSSNIQLFSCLTFTCPSVNNRLSYILPLLVQVPATILSNIWLSSFLLFCYSTILINNKFLNVAVVDI
jgi:hypothetical protein